MPRPGPGPRPYECVRRAWHSDRHQPMRGSFIQKMLRVVHKVHEPETRLNTEWQTKLPTVVMRVEQILYSKANSEAEYLNSETLFMRLNDAINTIIRREDTETGQYIHPCIEAALLLGCVPVRESRSQQLKKPRKYLNRNLDEPAQAAQPIVDNTNHHKPPLRPILPNNQSTKSLRPNLGSSNCSPFSVQMAPSTSRITAHGCPELQPNYPQLMPCMATEPNTSVNCGSVYPLYCGSHFQNVELRGPQNSYLKNVLMGRPVGWPGIQPTDYGPSTMNLLPDIDAETITNELTPVELVDRRGKAVAEDCDLSLRLGPSYPIEKDVVHVGEDGSPSCQLESVQHLARSLEFCFLPSCSLRDPPESYSYNNEVEKASDKREASKKRKALTIVI